MWQLASGRVARELRTGDNVTGVHATADATHIVTNDRAGGTQLWDVATGERVDAPEGRTTMVSAFAVDRDGVRGISGDADGNATIWNLDAGEPVHRLPCRAEVVTAVAITADGQTAATGSLTGEIVVWDVVTGIPLHRFSCPAVVSALALTPNGDRVLVGDYESLSVHPLADTSPQPPIARLITRSGVTALAVNPALPAYVLCGTASGQVAYVRTP